MGAGRRGLVWRCAYADRAHNSWLPHACFLLVGSASKLTVTGAGQPATMGERGNKHNYKIVLLGEGRVGKTSMVLRYVNNVFSGVWPECRSGAQEPGSRQTASYRKPPVLIPACFTQTSSKLPFKRPS